MTAAKPNNTWIKRARTRPVFWVLPIAFLFCVAGWWAHDGLSSSAMRWYTAPLHRDQFAQTQNFFRRITPATQTLVLNNLYVNKVYGVDNVCGELNAQRDDGGSTGFQLFYVKLVAGGPKDFFIVLPDLKDEAVAKWKTHCGVGKDSARLFSDRLRRLTSAAQTST
jgi:hypothetical protein